MVRERQGQIPGVKDAELVAALADLAKLPETTVDVADRFGSEVRAIVEDRAQRGWIGEGNEDVAVFLHTPYPRKVGEKVGATTVLNLVANGRPILGKIFFLNPDASFGQVIDLPVAVDEILDWLIAENLGGQPLVFAYRTSKLLLTRVGADADGIMRRDAIRDRPPAVTLQEISDALVHTHKEHLIAPGVCPPNVWETAHEYVPGPRPEKVIQRQLGTDLRSWFRGTVRAEFESTLPLGRIDIRLLYRRDGAWTVWTVLELKLLRSYHNPPTGKKAKSVSLAANVEAVVEGVRQVNAFAKDNHAEPLLEVFDLRKVKQPDILKATAVAQELAKCQPVPNCRVWPLFGSAGDARRAGFQ
jgi:hypothetical protein